MLIIVAANAGTMIRSFICRFAAPKCSFDLRYVPTTARDSIMRLFIICKPYMNPVFNCKFLCFPGIRSLVLRETAETETKKGGD